MRFFFTFLLLTSYLICTANIKMPQVFSDNMVLQRDIPLKVWGWADKGEKVTVTFNGQNASTKADNGGKWLIQLKPMKFGGPYEMSVKGKNEIILKNILIGDVWICSGQSNMEFALHNCNDAIKEVENANFPNIRHLDVPNIMGDVPKDDFEGKGWQVCSPETAGAFTGVGYFFAKNLHQHLNIPIGLINSSWGGTNVEAWMSADAFAENSDAKNTNKIKDIEAKQLQIKKESEEWMKSIEKLDSGRIGSWEKTIVFSDWDQVLMPGTIEKQYVNFDGIVWIAKEFYLTAAEAQQKIILLLGSIDDNDQTYINGQLVATTNGYNVIRKYEIAPSYLKTGKNIVIIRIEDTGGGSGISAETKDLKIITVGNSKQLTGDWYVKIGVNIIRKSAFMLSPNNYPGSLYNGMIHPFINYAIKGAIWYQGEANAGNPKLYNAHFPAMIKDWRTKWGEGDFPFLFVQLANFITGPDWPGLREAQLNTLSLPKTGMAVTIDIGNPTDIHPKNKQDVGYRLSLAARKMAYNETLTYSGPVFKSVTFEKGKAILEFDHCGTGLVCKNKYGYLSGFELAGKDKNYKFTKAEIKDGKVILSNDEIKDPAFVRYAWDCNPEEANLFNKEGLPATPFRSGE